MTPQQAKQYVENHLQQLGWGGLSVTREAAELISEFVNGNKYEIDQLCSILVSLGGNARKDYRVTRAAVKSAIRDLDALDKSPHQSGTETPNQPTTPPDRPTDKDILSIEQLAAELERKMLGASIEAPAVRQIQTEQPQEDSGKPKVLIVDDSPTVRIVINAALGNDFVCVEAKDGEVAWNMLLTDPRVAVAIVDLQMPALDGYGLIRRIRAAHIAHIAAIPIIVVTSATDTIAKKEAYVAGADDFISKTSDPLDLLVRVRTHFRLAQTKSALEHERRIARSNTAIEPRNVEVPTLNQQVSSTSQRLAIQGGPKANDDASARPVRDDADEPPASPSTTRLSPGPARKKDTRAFPIVRMTLVATALVIIVIGFVRYQHRIDQVQTAEDINLVGREQVTPEQQLLDAHQQPADPSMQVAQEDLSKKEPRADGKFSSKSTDQLSDVQLSNAAHALIGALQNDPSGAAEQQQTKPSATVDAKAPTTPAQSPASAPAVMQLGSAVVAPSQGAPPSAAKESHQRSTAPAQETAREPAPRALSPQSTADRSTRRIPAPAELPARPQHKEPLVSDRPNQTQNVAAYTGAAAPLETAAATQLERPSSSITSPSVGTKSTSVDATSQDLAARAITRAEVNAMLQEFVANYQAGDLDAFMNLFSEQAHTNERMNRDEIRRDYLNLFRTTDTRRMALEGVTWNLGNNQAQGVGNFNVKVQRKGEREVRAYTGSLSFSIEKQGQELRITRLYHYQSKADAQ